MGYNDTFERKEVKYRLDAAQARVVREALLRHGMAPDDFGRTTVTSTYYDTRDRSLIARSLEKPLYKEKLRLRTYGARTGASTVFVELKKKYDGVVYKRRVAVSHEAARLMMAGVPYECAVTRRPAADELAAADALRPHSCQIAAEIAAFVSRYRPLYPSMDIACERVAWAPREGSPRPADAAGLRVTFDERIRYRDLRDPSRPRLARALLGAGEVVVEVKAAGAYPLWLAHALGSCGAYPTSFSKYGAAYEACLAPREPVALALAAS